MTNLTRRLAAATAASIAVAVPATIAIAPAADAAGSPGCVTRAEFRKVKNGMSVKQVKHIYGTGGRVSVASGSGGYKFVIRDYNACGAWNVTNVSFQSKPGGPLKVTGKLFI